MSLFSKKKPVSGNTITVVSKTIQLIKRQTFIAKQEYDYTYTLNPQSTFHIEILIKYSNGLVRRNQIFNHTSDENMANEMYEFAIKSKGEQIMRDVLKESEINS